ncbi:MAG: hypothetical protein VKJ06_08895 [Vampirovibrionales bacterium]|nr:hypothetical protein [Vampirovibrionales bacterium]
MRQFVKFALISVTALGLLASTLTVTAVTPLDDLSANQVPQVINDQKVINLVLRQVPVAEAMRAIARQAGFNVVVDETVVGLISVNLNKVTVHDALATLRGFGQLAYAKQNDTLLVSTSNAIQAKALNKTASYILPLKYANAVAISDLLNNTLFASPTGEMQPVARPDFHTNRIMLQATVGELATAKAYVEKLDMPRELKTWRLSHADVMHVTSMLSASIFNNGLQPPIMLGGAAGGGAGGAAAGGAGGAGGIGGVGQGTVPASLRIRKETLTEGSQGGGSGEGAGDLALSMTLRARVKQDDLIQVNSQGPILVPDTRLNALTVMGTAEQIQMVDELIPVLDRKLPQVMIEASLVELSDVAIKELGTSFGIIGGRQAGSFNNTQSGRIGSVNNPFSNPVGIPTSVLSSYDTLFRYSTDSLLPGRTNYVGQINALIQSKKAKLLANPNIIAMHDNEAVISIVDEIVRSVEVTESSFVGAGEFSSEATIGQAGIILNLLPRVGYDGTVTMRVRPTISTVRQVTQDRFGNLVTLLSKRQSQAQQVTLKNNQSLILSGLIQETNAEVIRKIPILGDLPILGALARNNNRGRSRTELVVILTPHILTESSGLMTPSRVLTSSYNANKPK